MFNGAVIHCNAGGQFSIPYLCNAFTLFAVYQLVWHSVPHLRDGKISKVCFLVLLVMLLKEQKSAKNDLQMKSIALADKKWSLNGVDSL